MQQKDDAKRRYAFEWFVKEEDRWYWERTQNFIERKTKRITALAATSTVISVLAIAFSIFALLRKSQ